MSTRVITTAGLVIVVAGMKLGSGLLSPLILATFLAILVLPAMRWLERKGLPRWAAVLLVVLGVLAFLVALALFTLFSLNQVRLRLPAYQAQLTTLAEQAGLWLGRIGVDPGEVDFSVLDPATIVSAVTSVLRQTVSALVFAVLILLAVVFVVLESSRFGSKLRYGLGDDNPLVPKIAEFAEDVQRFFYLRTLNNLIVAVGAAIFLLVLGIDFALAWAVLIFFLSYIPNIGIVLACIPAVTLALLQYGWAMALVIVVGLTAINYIGDYGLTPRLMSQGLGLSQLAVFVSFFVWAYIFGAVGGLFSVPLTLFVKLLLETSGETRWLAVLMDDRLPVVERPDDKGPDDKSRDRVEEAARPPGQRSA